MGLKLLVFDLLFVFRFVVFKLWFLGFVSVVVRRGLLCGFRLGFACFVVVG